MDDGAATGGASAPPTSATRADGTCVHGAFLRSGVCACALDTPTVCADTCFDLTTDPDHCGACDHACGPTSTCLRRVCGPAPLVLVPPMSPGCGQIDLAVGDGVLAWTERDLGNVWSSLLATGDVHLVSKREPLAAHPSVRGAEVFWLSGQVIRRGNVGGGPAFNWLLGGGQYVVSPDGRSLYYSIDSEIHALLNGSAAPSLIATFGREHPASLALLDDKLVATVDAGFVEAVTLVPDDVARCEASDASGNDVSHDCVRLALGENINQEMLVIAPGPRALWAEGVSLLGSRSLDEPGKESLALGDDDVSGIATDGTWIYYATTGPGLLPPADVIYKVGTRPGQIGGAIARGQVAPRALATDGKRLYWSTSDCAIEALDL